MYTGPQTQRSPHCASQTLGLKVCVTTPRSFVLHFSKFNLQPCSRSILTRDLDLKGNRKPREGPDPVSTLCSPDSSLSAPPRSPYFPPTVPVWGNRAWFYKRAFEPKQKRIWDGLVPLFFLLLTIKFSLNLPSEAVLSGSPT